MHTIYLVRKDSKPVYVGYTSRTLEDRWKEHIEKCKKPKYPIHHAIKKHGVESFSIEILYESEDEYHTLNFMEHHYIWLYRTHGSLGGYNLTIGGEGKSKGVTEKERKEQRKAWREENRERIRYYQKTYYEANKDKMKNNQKTYYEENKDTKKAQMKAYGETNKERRKEYGKTWYEANRDKRKAWREAYNARRKAT
jgi:hypothetical protein